MKRIDELLKGLGPARAKELREAFAAHDAAKGVLEALQAELAGHRQGQAAPQVMVVAGVGVAELGAKMQAAQAHTALIDHLTHEQIPQAQRELATTAALANKLVEAVARRQAHVEAQRVIIDKAQREVDRAQGWLDA